MKKRVNDQINVGTDKTDKKSSVKKPDVKNTVQNGVKKNSNIHRH